MSVFPAPPEIETVAASRVACDGEACDGEACDGEGGALGHPRIWLTPGAGGEVTCPYCNKKFVLSLAPAGRAEH